MYSNHSSGRPRIFRLLGSVGNANSCSSSPVRCTGEREREEFMRMKREKEDRESLQKREEGDLQKKES